MITIPLDFKEAMKDSGRFTRSIPGRIGVTLNKELILAGEFFFDPKTLLHDCDSSLFPLQELIAMSIENTEMSAREELASHIVLSGATTRLPGFDQRLEKELKLRLPFMADRVNVSTGHLHEREKLIYRGAHFCLKRLTEREILEEETIVSAQHDGLFSSSPDTLSELDPVTSPTHKNKVITIKKSEAPSNNTSSKWIDRFSLADSSSSSSLTSLLLSSRILPSSHFYTTRTSLSRTPSPAPPMVSLTRKTPKKKGKRKKKKGRKVSDNSSDLLFYRER